MKVKIVAAISVLACAFGTFGLTALTSASSAQTTPVLNTTCSTSNCLVQHTTGTNASGQPVDLTTTVNRFVNQHGSLLANVTTTGTVNGSPITPITQNVPVSSLDPSGSCSILDLTLGPLHLNVLGLVPFSAVDGG